MARKPFDWWKVLVAIGIGAVFVVANAVMVANRRIAQMAPAGRALSNRNPAEFQRWLRDYQEETEDDPAAP